MIIYYNRMSDDVDDKKKRIDVSKRLEENRNLSFHIIKMKLSRFSKSSSFDLILKDNIKNMNKMRTLAYHLINFHILRCLKDNITLPNLQSLNFYYRTLATVSKLNNRSSKERENDELLKTYNQYMNTKDIETPYKDYSGNLMNNMSLEMKIAVTNHIILNFTKRLQRYTILKYGVKNINNLYDTTLYYVPNKNEKEIKDFVKIVPTTENIKNNLNHIIQLEYEIQKYFDSLEPDTKGVRNFSITPIKGSYIDGYVKVCTSCLKDLTKTNKDLKDLDKDTLWRTLFNLNEVETCNKKFHYEISTDGYGVSVTVGKSLGLDLFEVDEDDKVSCKCGCKVKRSGYKKHLDSSTHIKKMATKRKLDDTEEQFDRIVGLDPGVNQIYSAVDQDNNFMNCSSKQYRTKSKIKHSCEWNKRRCKEVQDTLNSLKSFKTVDIDKYKSAFEQYSKTYNELTFFYNSKAYKKWKFKTYCFRKKTISSMCKDICKNKKTLVGYGDWSKNQGIIKKHPSTPNKKLREALIRYKDCKVVSVNEYRTSKECSICHSVVKNVSKIHQIVRCSNNECSMCWQRDINASRNIIQKLYSENLGLNPPRVVSGGDRDLLPV